MGSIRTCFLQEDTLYGVKNDLSVTRRDVILCLSGLVSYKFSHYMGSIRTSLLRDCTLYGVNQDFSVTSIHVI
jgi:hypothetical protein